MSVTHEHPERTVVVAMMTTILLLHVVGAGLLLLAASRALPMADGGVFGIGLGLTAYSLGVRHAFDADHIAAVDNTTRKLVGEGGRPQSVGFWFSLGHSSVVMAVCVLLAIGVRATAGQAQDDGGDVQQVAAVIGAVVAGCFLLTMALVNLSDLSRIARLFVRMRDTEVDEAMLDVELARRGLMARALRPVMRLVRRPSHLYPVGVLF